MQTAYISHPDCLKHEMIDGHPEEPARLRAIDDQLMASQLFDFLRHYDAPAADKKDLLRVHSKEHVRNIFDNAPKPGDPLFHADPDTFMNEFTLPAALRAAGAGKYAVDLVMKEQVRNAFCAVRPPGHHAEHKQAMGFCFFNNIAVAAAYALEYYGLERVAIVDFDVHHGNGTEDIFAEHGQVMVCSSYEHPLYPFSGRPTVPGRLINTPLGKGSAGPEFRMAVQQHWLPALEEFKPQMLFISAGFDAHWEDDMANLQFNESDYVWVTKKMMEIAETHCQERIVSMLEGGYVLQALGRSVSQHIKALMGI